jgi:hypothetical protein
MHGRIRSGPAARWIPFESEQYNIVGEPARVFYLTGSMMMVPVLGYHRFVGTSATMKIAGELTDFRSDDRYQISADGRSARRVRWSTPIRDYRRFGNVRLASAGEGRWHEAAADYAYIRLTIDDVAHNVPARS